jgi:hypothetical protein
MLPSPSPPLGALGGEGRGEGPSGAILTYFIYPLLTCILGAMTGIDRLTVTGAAAC